MAKAAPVTDKAVRDVLVEVRDEIVAGGRWTKGLYVDARDHAAAKKLRAETGLSYSSTAQPAPVCGWKFCLGGAVAWAALGGQSDEEKVKALRRRSKRFFFDRAEGESPRGFDVALRVVLMETPLARAALYELVSVINPSRLADYGITRENMVLGTHADILVSELINFNDKETRRRRDVVRKLDQAISSLDKRIAA